MALLSAAPAAAQAVEPPTSSARLAEIIPALAKGSYRLTGADGRVLAERVRAALPTRSIVLVDLLDSLKRAPLSAEEAAALWAAVADSENAGLVQADLIAALLTASATPKAREAFWSELAAIARAPRSRDAAGKDRSLLKALERQRARFLPLLPPIKETASSATDMITLMTKSQMFGEDRDESVAFVASRIPADVARHIERERGLGHPVAWEYVAFESMMKWKSDRWGQSPPLAPRTLAESDDAGVSFITIFNCLHDLDSGYREVILRGLGAPDIFNAVVAGERELYRLGTSGYRDFLHAVVLKGITEARSFEAFLDRASPAVPGAHDPAVLGHRAMVFLRIASSFGLLESVLNTVAHRDVLIGEVIASLEDPQAFEDNSAVVLDVLTAPRPSATTQEFRNALLAALYARYALESRPALRTAFGSVLSVYQTVSNDRRDAQIDHDFPLDSAPFDLAFDRLFLREDGGVLVHRMFMRMEETGDAVETLKSFKRLAAKLGARHEPRKNYDVFHFTSPGRRIEIYANAPTRAGLDDGVARIAADLKGARVETVIGRGHSSIIGPLQADAKRALGDRLTSVATVIVGSCGGDVAVRDLIATFGYIPFVATKATGRQVINNAIIATYIKALQEMSPDGRLSMPHTLARAVSRFRDDSVPEAIQSDAALYQVNMPAVLTAKLFDQRVRRELESARRAALD